MVIIAFYTIAKYLMAGHEKATNHKDIKHSVSLSMNLGYSLFPTTSTSMASSPLVGLEELNAKNMLFHKKQRRNMPALYSLLISFILSVLHKG